MHFHRATQSCNFPPWLSRSCLVQQAKAHRRLLCFYIHQTGWLQLDRISPHISQNSLTQKKNPHSALSPCMCSLLSNRSLKSSTNRRVWGAFHFYLWCSVFILEGHIFCTDCTSQTRTLVSLGRSRSELSSPLRKCQYVTAGSAVLLKRMRRADLIGHD